jgi:hypothetical protein
MSFEEPPTPLGEYGDIDPSGEMGFDTPLSFDFGYSSLGEADET